MNFLLQVIVELFFSYNLRVKKNIQIRSDMYGQVVKLFFTTSKNVFKCLRNQQQGEGWYSSKIYIIVILFCIIKMKVFSGKCRGLKMFSALFQMGFRYLIFFI